MRIINIISFTILFICSFFIDSFLFIPIVMYALIIQFGLNISGNKKYIQTALIVFTFAGFFSLLYSYEYMSLYNDSFGPYYDDSLYYFNSILLSNFQVGLPPTLFEVVLAVPQFISYNLFNVYIPHIFLLPINWMLSSFSAVVLLKILSFFFNINKEKEIYILLPILFNYNFIDTAIHLYRDVLMIFFILLFIYNMIVDNKKWTLFFGVCVFFIRGANGVLLLLFYILHYAITIKGYSFKKIAFVSIFPILILFYFSGSINSSFFRGGFSNVQSSNLQERLTSRMDYNRLEGEGGSMSLRNSNNIVVKSIYPLVYTFSPFILETEAKQINVIHSSIEQIFGYSLREFKFSKMYNLPFYFHILSIAFFVIPILYGLFIGLRSQNKYFVILSIFFIIQVLAISIISMQARHRLPIVFLFPVFYILALRSREYKTSIIPKISVIIFIIIILINLYLNYIS